MVSRLHRAPQIAHFSRRTELRSEQSRTLIKGPHFLLHTMYSYVYVFIPDHRTKGCLLMGSLVLHSTNVHLPECFFECNDSARRSARKMDTSGK